MKGLKRGAILSFIISMLVLLLGGYFAMDRLAPYPEKVVIEGKEIITENDIKKGQDVYRKYGLMDHGSVWGHGTLRGMDFSATTLNMLGAEMRDYYAVEIGKLYSEISADEKAAIDTKVIKEIKENRYDKSTETLTLTPAQFYAY